MKTYSEYCKLGFVCVCCISWYCHL